VSREQLLDVFNRNSAICIIANLDHAWILESWLRSLALVHGEERMRHLDAMLTYAGTKAWMDAGSISGHTLRAARRCRLRSGG
jgi:hypothetical protein